VLALRAEHLHPSAAALDRSGTVSQTFVYLMTGAVPLFLVWLARARRNARLLVPGAAPVSGFWSVAAWFIPFVNWWVPRGFVLDVERAGARAAGRKSGDLLVNAWWGAWVGHMVLGSVLQSGGGTDLALLVVAEASMIAAAVLAVLVIERVTGSQAAALSAGPPPVTTSANEPSPATPQ
jgi:hypothetical protein